MRYLILFAILCISCLAALGQTPQSTPRPQSTPAPTPQPQITPQPIRMGQQAVDTRRLQSFSLNPLSESDRLASKIVQLQRLVAPLYRKPTSKELLEVAPSGEMLAKYADLLRQPNTGIFKLVPDTGCAPNMRVVSAREDCLRYSMPGAANSYSFRTENYRIKHLADITFDGDELTVTGLFMHGLVTKLGDLPIESVGLSTNGLKFIVDFKPSNSADDVRLIDDSFAKGIEVKGFRYAKASPAEENMTYAYRGVAYRGKLVRSADGVMYNELDYDKREDVIVAFRIVEKAMDGSITIVWKQLAEYESPRIKMPNPKEDKNEADAGN
ncbi:MAG: hypothetical protein KIT61_03145 [Pyrinomonadaceae bacterium]|nr:hypothetical protein [Blastocatellia bacterium]MCW5955554.1 hypothetical protein [Pyrinomonadaceae bacterium]